MQVTVAEPAGVSSDTIPVHGDRRRQHTWVPLMVRERTAHAGRGQGGAQYAASATQACRYVRSILGVGGAGREDVGTLILRADRKLSSSDIVAVKGGALKVRARVCEGGRIEICSMRRRYECSRGDG